MDQIKSWIIETWGPSAIRGAVLGIGGILIAHAAVMAKFGVFYDAATHIVTIHLTTLSDFIIPIAVGIVAGFIKTGHVTLTKTISQGETK